MMNLSWTWCTRIARADGLLSNDSRNAVHASPYPGAYLPSRDARMSRHAGQLAPVRLVAASGLARCQVGAEQSLACDAGLGERRAPSVRILLASEVPVTPVSAA
jgi:hypothetical protein